LPPLALFTTALAPLSFSPYPSLPLLFTLSLHDALPISPPLVPVTYRNRLRNYSRLKVTFTRPMKATCLPSCMAGVKFSCMAASRSEEHTSELQSRVELVCRLLLEKKSALQYVSDTNLYV